MNAGVFVFHQSISVCLISLARFGFFFFWFGKTSLLNDLWTTVDLTGPTGGQETRQCVSLKYGAKGVHLHSSHL